MKLEDESSYLSFLKTWEEERDRMTPEDINELVTELAQSYYSAISRYSEIEKQMQITMRDEGKAC